MAGFIVLTGLAFVLKNGRRKLGIDLLLVFATLFVIGSIYTSFESRSAGSALLEADKGELALKFNSGFIAFRNKGLEVLGSNEDAKSKRMAKEMQDKFYDEANKALEKAIKNIDDPVIAAPVLAKQTILLAEMGDKGFKKTFAKLEQVKSEKAVALSNLLRVTYIDKHLDPAKLNETRESLNKELKPGWYREVLDVQLEKAAGNDKEFKKKALAFMDRYFNYLLKVVCFVILVILSALIGVIVIIVQLFFLPRTPTSEADRDLIAAPGDWSGRVVYGVFVGWLSIQYLIVPIMSSWTKNFATLATEHGALAVGALTAGLYLMQNVPSLILAWLLAYRPAGIKFLEGIRFRTKVGKVGIFRLVGAGVLTWFAAVPLVIVSTAIAVKLGSQGSANPIVPIVLSAAKDPNPLAALMFFITLGVLPALCEESLFRGFLYTSLRRKRGVFFSILFTAAFFSAIHQDLGGALQLFALGSLFAYVFERTKSLIPAMVAHCMWNSGTFVAALTIFG